MYLLKKNYGGDSMNPLITETVQGEPYHYYPIGKYIVRAVGVCGGVPNF